MTSRGVWVGRSLRVLGLVAVIVAIYLGGWPAVLAAVAAALVTFGLTIHAVVGFWRSGGRRTGLTAIHPTDFAHTLDLLRRAHGAHSGWAVGLEVGDVEVTSHDGDPIDPAVRRRGAAIVQLASVDGRAHLVKEAAGSFVAVGDFPYGAGLLLAQPDAGQALAAAVTEDLRRLVAGMRVVEAAAEMAQTDQIAKRLGAIAGGAQTLESIARAGAELAQQLSQRGTVIVVAEGGGSGKGGGDGAKVVAVSTSADRRLAGLVLSAEAPAVRAIVSGVPVATQHGEDIFGPGVPERRRQDRIGTAYPLKDGHFAVGALVLGGPPIPPDGAVAEQLSRLLLELGPRLVAAQAVHEAEQRAVRDPLTGLSNRRELERRMSRFADDVTKKPEPAALIYADLDRFKTLNDTLGHSAGDSALRSVAAILQSQTRDGDLAARIGGEEFAIWLPRTALPEALEIAERIRRSVEGTQWRWNGTAYSITASCGVAAFPDLVGDVNNLRTAADAALYRAKQGGRNRVESATREAAR